MDVHFPIDLNRPTAGREIKTLFRLFCDRLEPDARSSNASFSATLDLLVDVLTSCGSPLAHNIVFIRPFVDALLDVHNRTDAGERIRATELLRDWSDDSTSNWRFRDYNFGGLTISVNPTLKVATFQFHDPLPYGEKLAGKLRAMWRVNEPIPDIGQEFYRPDDDDDLF